MAVFDSGEHGGRAKIQVQPERGWAQWQQFSVAMLPDDKAIIIFKIIGAPQAELDGFTRSGGGHPV
jgi:hypothetical protein